MHEFVDDSFQESNLQDYILSIQVSLNGFSFSIHSIEDRKLLFFKSSELKISGEQLIARRFVEWFESEKLLQNDYKTKNVIVFSNNFTLIPKAFAEDGHGNILPQVLFSGDKCEFAATQIDILNARLLFALPNDLKETLENKIGEFNITHPIKEIISQYPKNNEPKQLLLLFDEHDMYFLLITDHNIAVCNTFKIKHANDAIYFILTALKQFSTQVKNIPVYFAGKGQYSEALIKMLPTYFDTVEKLVSQDNGKELQFKETVINQYISLF